MFASLSKAQPLSELSISHADVQSTCSQRCTLDAIQDNILKTLIQLQSSVYNLLAFLWSSSSSREARRLATLNVTYLQQRKKYFENTHSDTWALQTTLNLNVTRLRSEPPQNTDCRCKFWIFFARKQSCQKVIIRRPLREADNLTTFMCGMLWKSGSLNLLETSGPHRACYGTLLALPLHTYRAAPFHLLCLKSITSHASFKTVVMKPHTVQFDQFPWPKIFNFFFQERDKIKTPGV